MQTKTRNLLIVIALFFCGVGCFIFWALIPRIFGKIYTIKVANVSVINLPFGNYISVTPKIGFGEKKDPNSLPCETIYAPLTREGDAYVLSNSFFCAPQSGTPYLKGNKTPYGISFLLGNFYTTPEESENIQENQQDHIFLAEIYLYQGRANLNGLIY